MAIGYIFSSPHSNKTKSVIDICKIFKLSTKDALAFLENNVTYNLPLIEVEMSVEQHNQLVTLNWSASLKREEIPYKPWSEKDPEEVKKTEEAEAWLENLNSVEKAYVQTLIENSRPIWIG